MSLAPEPNRIEELLAEEAVFGLTPELRSELDNLLETSPEEETADFDEVAAVYYMAAAPLEIETMPSGLHQKVLDKVYTEAIRKPSFNDAISSLAESSDNLPTDAVSPAVTAPVATQAMRTKATGTKARGAQPLGWVLALAASLLIGFFLGSPVKESEPTVAKVLSPEEARSSLLESGAKITQVPWTATEAPEAKGASGDIVWSDADQKGYMTFRGLAPNDPSKEQYQLWIFDAERDDRYPVDGGVFDIPEGESEVFTPIVAKIDVSKAVMFAITIEEPGGVVVSDRSRLPLVAKVD